MIQMQDTDGTLHTDRVVEQVLEHIPRLPQLKLGDEPEGGD